MARITVEDCLKNISNRFELVLIASKRARQLAVEGADPHVPVEGDKSTVIALREIAERFIDKSILDESKAKVIKTAVEIEDIPSDIIAETQQIGEASLQEGGEDSTDKDVTGEDVDTGEEGNPVEEGGDDAANDSSSDQGDEGTIGGASGFNSINVE